VAWRSIGGGDHQHGSMAASGRRESGAGISVA